MCQVTKCEDCAQVNTCGRCNELLRLLPGSELSEMLRRLYVRRWVRSTREV